VSRQRHRQRHSFYIWFKQLLFYFSIVHFVWTSELYCIRRRWNNNHWCDCHWLYCSYSAIWVGHIFCLLSQHQQIRLRNLGYVLLFKHAFCHSSFDREQRRRAWLAKFNAILLNAILLNAIVLKILLCTVSIVLQ
jgi:hypothetical protein